jgi:hypothetical protein
MRSALRWAAAGLFFGLLIAWIVRHGPLTLAPPLTPLSNAEPAEKASEPYLVFLGEIRLRVPARSTIAVLDDTGEIGYMLAIGQLQDQIVMHSSALLRGPRPDWVAAFRREFRDPGYALAGRFSGGALYRRAR